ncbi:hypothetical protein KAW48_09665 [candidate division WOR-3 bacterium]|nr:hypothetical protein [candidate division WOR-3 bacterium]
MKNKRSHLIPKEVFRLRIINTLIGILIALIVVLILFAISLFYWVPAGRHIFSEGGLNSPAGQNIILAGKILIGLTLFLAIILFWSVYLIGSRFLGPLIRLSMDIEELGSGEKPEELRFREGDEWEFHSLAVSLNEVFREFGEFKEIEEEIIKFNDMLEKKKKKPKEAVTFIKELTTKLKKE